MKNLLFSLLLTACASPLFAQTSVIYGLEWVGNPATVHGEVATSTGTLGGSAQDNGRMTLAAMRYANHDTAWIRTYGNHNLDLVARNMHHDRPGMYTYAGLAADTSTVLAMLARIDSADGTVQWAKTFAAGLYSDFTGTVETATGSLAYGQVFDFSGSRGLLVSLDTAGDTLWTCQYEVPSALQFNGAHRLGSGFIVVGSYLYPGAGGDHVFVMRIDASGAVIWAKHYISGRTEWVQDSEMDGNGNVYLAVTSDDTTQLAAEMRLMCIDSGGNFRFGKSLSLNSYDESFSILHWRGEGIFLAGTTGDGSTGAALVSRFTEAGQFQWAKSYIPGGYAEPQSLARIGDSGLLVAVVDENSTMGVTLIEMDSSGTLASPCSFTTESPTITAYTPVTQAMTVNRLRGMTVTNLSLSATRPATPTQVVCMATAVMPAMEASLQVWPQPMAEEATLQLPEGSDATEMLFECFDLRGRRVPLAWSPTAEGLQLWRNGLPAGLYTYRLRYAYGKVVAAGRLVLQ